MGNPLNADVREVVDQDVVTPETLEILASRNTGVFLRTSHGQIAFAPDLDNGRIVVGIIENGNLASAFLDDVKKFDRLCDILQGYRMLLAKRRG